jgi:signal transduction histidine kinase
LDPDGDHVDASRRLVLRTYDDIERGLNQYVPILDSAAEQARLDSLHAEIASFTGTLLDVLATDRRQWRRQAPLLLATILPRRTSVMQISDDFQKLNRSAFVRQQQVLAQIYAETQSRVWQTLIAALAASFAIALFATSYVAGLERDLQRQRVRERHTTEDLQRLSAKLVTAQEEERRTIARELHDEVGQVLMATKVELALAQRRVEAIGGPADLLNEAQAITDGALTTIRDLSHLLHPTLLDDLGLPAALESYVAGFGKRHGIPVEFLQDGAYERLTPHIEAAAYRIVQEALTNVVKHSQATLAFVYIRRVGDLLEVCVEDNGIGFDAERARRGLGLLGIRERVAHLGGHVSVDSAAGNGTRVSIALPARARAAAPDAGEFEATTASDPLANPEVTLG